MQDQNYKTMNYTLTVDITENGVTYKEGTLVTALEVKDSKCTTCKTRVTLAESGCTTFYVHNWRLKPISKAKKKHNWW